MTLIIFMIYLSLSFILFVIENLKNNLKEITKKVIIPIIYIIILSGIFSGLNINNLNNNIFLIIVLEFIIRLYYENYILKKNITVIDEKSIIYYPVVIIISYIINKDLINKVSSIFPTAEEMKLILWFIIIYILINKLKDFEIKDINNNKNNTLIKKDYCISTYAKLKVKYNDNISSKIDKDLLLSIMVNENYNRPEYLRKIDNIKNKYFSTLTKQGIMQVESNKIIDDLESIKLSEKKIEKISKKLDTKKIKKSELNTEIIKEYYKNETDKQKITIEIYNEIMSFNNIK